jgi:hypothetical protein
MKEIESILEPITGYLLSMTRNTQEGWYELQVGIPNTWVFTENNEISCEVINENESGKLLKIFPKNYDVCIDDLFQFVIIIIDTNRIIVEKEKEFAERMAERKRSLEKEANEFLKELDDLREISFKEQVSDLKTTETKTMSRNKKKPVVVTGETIGNQ